LNPRKVAPTDWLIFGEHDSDRVNDLLAALDKNQFSELLASLPPPHPNYQRLRDGMKALRQMEANGGWPQILPTGDKLEPGKSNPEIPLLRARLLRGGELPFCQWKRLMNHAACWWDWQAMGKLDSRQYDSPLAEAVRAFQHRHSIEADGVIGPATRQALNVPVGQRIRQLAANMERWRWLPRDFGPRYIMVNVAGFLLGVFENNQQIDQMAVIVGTAYRKTPAFRSEMEQIVFNPRWNVPYRNATEDLLPRLKKDASKVAREGFRAFAGKQEVSVDSIDWSQYSKRNFPYHLQQRPGKHNALGQIKFVFPNHFAVYMHDTPKRHLFKKAVRNFSSGCVRLEEPLELAEYVLKNPDKWTQEGIQQAIDAGKTRHVSLPEKVPVYILYWTAWVEDNGVLHFSEDIYKRDPPILNALEAGGDMPGNLPPPDALIANQDGGAG
jgi:murein L,D-transpeptidase YcbB/YkuD